MTKIKAHNAAKKFLTRPRLMPRSAVEYDYWEFRRDGLIFYGTGLCPQCFAPDQHGTATVTQTLPESFPGWGGNKDKVFRVEAPTTHGPDDYHPDLRCECDCGSDHGVDGAGGCGATWVVTWQRP